MENKAKSIYKYGGQLVLVAFARQYLELASMYHAYIL